MAFIVFALPRSRTAWLSQFLSYGDWHCGHEEMRHVRSLEDVKSWFSQPYVGTAETAAAPFWRTVARLTPDIKVVVVRRPVAEVVASLMRLGSFDQEALEADMKRLDRKLQQIERRVPGVLSVNYADLNDEAVCARIFEHCLPYSHDSARWQVLSKINVQVSLPQMQRYAAAYAPQLKKAAEQAAVATFADLSRRKFALNVPAEFSVVDLEEARRAGIAEQMGSEHTAYVGEGAHGYFEKNQDELGRAAAAGNLHVVLARQQGRPVGYMLIHLTDSNEVPGSRTATVYTAYASPALPGLGRKMYQFACQSLREVGARELIVRTVRCGDGPRMANFYRRLGAVPHGELFCITL